MDVIFLDFDGVIDTIHYSSYSDVEKRIQILADICKEYNCKIVIEAAAKGAINEETLEVDGDWVQHIFRLFEKYGIECIGRTPDVSKKINEYVTTPMWKEDEIRLYLLRHPEIEHYCVIDDDDLADMHKKSDLDKVRDHLLKTIYYSSNPEEEGLLETHKKQIGEILQKENEIRRLVLKKRLNNN